MTIQIDVKRLIYQLLTVQSMGNQYSLTKYATSSHSSYEPVYLNPGRLAMIATCAVIDTAHVAVKTTVANYVPPQYNQMQVAEHISDVKNETAIYIKIFAVWIRNGSLSGPLSTITGVATGTALTHWFAQIKTNDPNVWYWAELNNHGISLQSCPSSNDVKDKGAQSCCNNNAENFSVKMQKSCNRSLTDIKSWTKNSNHRYHLTLHNCQHWAEELFEWI